MKIQILSSGRSGSTNLMVGLAQSIQNTQLIFEPLSKVSVYYKHYLKDLPNHINQLNKFSQKHVIIEKNLIFSPIELFPKGLVNFYLNYIQNFDKTIILIRKNINEVTESFLHAKSTGNWHEKYSLTEQIIKNNNYKEELNNVKVYNNILLEISKKSNTKIYYYEDLFSGNFELIFNFVKENKLKIDNINILYDYLDPLRRYKQI